MIRTIAAGVFFASFACVAVAACGSGPDLANDVDVKLVAISQSNTNTCFGCTFISGVALGQQGAYVAMEQNNGGDAIPSLAALDFSKGIAAQSSWPLSMGGTTPLSFGGDTCDIAASGDGALYWAAPIRSDGTSDPDAGGKGSGNQAFVEIFSSTEAAFSMPPNQLSLTGPLPAVSPVDGGATFNNTPTLVGIVADANAVYVAYSQSQTGQVGQGPDAPFYPGSAPADSNGAGLVARIDRNAPGAPKTVQGFSFSPGVAVHVLAQNKTDVFWPDYGQEGRAVSIDDASKDTFATNAPSSFVALANSDPNTPSVTLVGLAANDQLVAWTAAQEPGKQGSSNVSGCQIWVRPNGGSPKAIFDTFTDKSDPNFSCDGLAVDGTYAYVADTSLLQTSNGGGGLVTIGNGIARVPLAGGKMQKVPLQSRKWYGPRRVFVDDTYVYAIDPTHVARFSKSDFR